MIPLFEIWRTGKFTDTESRLEITWDWGVEGVNLMVTDFLFDVMKKLQK